MRYGFLFATILLLGVLSAYGEEFSFETPGDDRWHYPFNFTPGTRATGSCFGAAAIPDFNDRDGLVIVAWNTGPMIDPGLGPDAYVIQSITVTLTNQANQFVNPQWPIDLTTDEWFTFDLDGDGVINGDGIPRGEPGDVDGESDDEDCGRPLELFGAGFGPVFSPTTWAQTSLYVGSSGGGDVPRDPFPFVFQEKTLEFLHVEDSVKGLHNEALDEPVLEFTPTPWAIGVPLDYIPGDQSVPFDVVFEIDLDLSNGAVTAFFQEQLHAGRVIIVVTSLRGASVMGPQSGFPSFFMKEGLGLDPDAKAARLDIVLCDITGGDFDADCDVDLIDLGLFQACFTGAGVSITDPECEVFDFEPDDDVDLDDFGEVRGMVTGRM